MRELAFCSADHPALWLGACLAVLSDWGAGVLWADDIADWLRPRRPTIFALPPSTANSCPSRPLEARNTPDEDALIQIAKDARNRGGVTPEQADILKDWGKEFGVPVRGPEVHPGRPFGKDPHIHVGPVDHIPVK